MLIETNLHNNNDYGGAANGSVPNPDELFVVVFDENGLFPPNGSPPNKSVDPNGSVLPYKYSPINVTLH